MGTAQYIGAAALVFMAWLFVVLVDAPIRTVGDEARWLWQKATSWDVVWPIVGTFWFFAGLMVDEHIYPSAMLLFVLGDLCLLIKFSYWVKEKKEKGKRAIPISIGIIAFLLSVWGEFAITQYIATASRPKELPSNSAQNRPALPTSPPASTPESPKVSAVKPTTHSKARVVPPQPAAKPPTYEIPSYEEGDPNAQPEDPVWKTASRLAALPKAQLAPLVTEVGRKMREYDRSWMWLGPPPPDSPPIVQEETPQSKDQMKMYWDNMKKWEQDKRKEVFKFRSTFQERFAQDILVLDELNSRYPEVSVSPQCSPVFQLTFEKGQLGTCADYLDKVVREKLD